jgi:hypothetical protein
LSSALVGVLRRVGAQLALVGALGLAAVTICEFLARREALTAQYQTRQMAVSSSRFAAVSVLSGDQNDAPISSDNVLEIRQNSAEKKQLNLYAHVGAAQHQTPKSESDDRRLMVRIALGLGLGYVVFLGCWIWAPRLRSRRERH